MSVTLSQNFKRELFGTDGIRGVAGEYPLDRTTVYAIGRALGQRLAERDKSASVVIGQDTRESSAWISQVLCQRTRSFAVNVISAGVITTPGVAYLTRENGYSRRHRDLRLAQSLARQWNQSVRRGWLQALRRTGTRHRSRHLLAHRAIRGRRFASRPAGYDMLPGDAKLRTQYAEWLASLVGPGRFGKLRVLVDCANGAASSNRSHGLPRLRHQRRLPAHRS